MIALLPISGAPLTRPVTRLPTTGNRRNVAHVASTWEATICDVSQIFSRLLARRPL